MAVSQPWEIPLVGEDTIAVSQLNSMITKQYDLWTVIAILYLKMSKRVWTYVIR